MLDSNHRMSDYLIELFDLEAYGCLRMTVAELMEEFEDFLVLDGNTRPLELRVSIAVCRQAS